MWLVFKEEPGYVFMHVPLWIKREINEVCGSLSLMELFTLKIKKGDQKGIEKGYPWLEFHSNILMKRIQCKESTSTNLSYHLIHALMKLWRIYGVFSLL